MPDPRLRLFCAFTTGISAVRSDAGVGVDPFDTATGSMAFIAEPLRLTLTGMTASLPAERFLSLTALCFVLLDFLAIFLTNILPLKFCARF